MTLLPVLETSRPEISSSSRRLREWFSTRNVIGSADPNPANDTLSLALDVALAPLLPPVLRVRKVRTDFFDRTPIAEVEIDQALLNRLAPFMTFRLEASSNLQDWNSSNMSA